MHDVQNSFLRERLHCEEALVSSACGDEAGNLAFMLRKLYTERISIRHGCDITRDTTYHGRLYNGQYLRQQTHHEMKIPERNMRVYLGRSP